MRVLVTGGAGFIGSHIVDQLIKQQYSVTVLDDLSTGLESNLHHQAQFIAMDIRSSQVLEVFQKGCFDFVIHQAAQTMVPKSLEDPRYDCEVNISGTINVLEACRITKVKKIVFASSAAVYGDVASIPVQEDAPTQPSSFYGLSKLTVERYLALYHNLFGIEYAALRYANVYGERQGDGGEGGVISIFTRKIHAGQSLGIFGSGEQTRDFIYVGDVASANIAAMASSGSSGIYNISTQSETTVNELIAVLSQVAKRTVEKIYMPIREGDIYRSSLANGKILEYFDWRPQMSLSDGIARTYQSLI